jgi:putative phage-type endonuclease
MALTQEQLALRRQGVTGSEIAAIAGLSPWSNATDVWQRKMGHEAQMVGNAHIARGNFLERPILEWYSQLEQRVVHPQTTLVHPEHRLIMATPDGISTAPGTEDRVVEVKCPSWTTARHWGEPGTDAVPIYFLPQLTFEMAVTGLKRADTVLFAGIEPKIYPVAYDPDFFDALHEIAEQFWRDHVVTGKPPPPDASASYAQFVAQYYPQAQPPKTIDLTDDRDATETVARLKSVQDTLELLEQERELCKNKLKAMMGEHAQARVSGGMLTWKQSKPVSRTSWKDVARAANLPDELIAAHTQASEPTRPFRIKWDC